MRGRLIRPLPCRPHFVRRFHSWGGDSGYSSTYGGSINWFPGHMAKASRQVTESLPKCDVVVEVRDARVPFSSANPMLDAILGSKLRFVVFNKADLAHESLQPRIRTAVEAAGHIPVFTTATKPRTIRKVRCPSSFLSVLALCLILVRARGKVPSRWMLWQVRKKVLQHVPPGFRVAGSVVLIAGLPNVGKSTIINAFRGLSLRQDQKRGAATGARPGLTRQMSAILVSRQPPVYLMDTPGIMSPRVPDVETGLKLALCNTLREAEVPPSALADYILHLVYSRRNLFALQQLGLLEQDGITTEEALRSVATSLHAKKPGGAADQEAAARHMVAQFRRGDLGPWTLDPV